MIEINLHQVDVNLHHDSATGLRTMRLVDEQSGIVVRLDFPEEQAQQLASALTLSRIVPVPASELPKVQH